MDKLYETLLQLPIFQGITIYDFSNLVGKLKWHFDKYQPEEIIVKAGEACDKVYCILSGDTSFTTESPKKVYSVTEYTKRPYIIEIQSLFGLSNKYKGTYKALTEVSIGSFSKLSFLTIINDFIICRLNTVNILSNRSQILYNRLWNDKLKKDFLLSVTLFLLTHVENMEGEKLYRIKIQDLADLLDISHVNISITLNKLEKEGLIKTERMSILIPDIKVLYERYKKHLYLVP